MSTNRECIFCKPDELKNKYIDSSECQRCIYEDERCFAILTPEQYTIGHSLVILKKHGANITDDLQSNEYSNFLHAINQVARLIKKSVKNENNESPENVYVSILCDGVKHIHAHLIPRYPFSKKDKMIYRKLFRKRDGDKLEDNISKGNIGGFWYLAEREKEWKSTQYGIKSTEDKIKFLEELREKILNSH